MVSSLAGSVSAAWGCDMLGDHQYIYLTYLGTGPPVLRAEVFPVLVNSPDPVNGPASRPRSAGVLVLFASHWVPVFLFMNLQSNAPSLT